MKRILTSLILLTISVGYATPPEVAKPQVEVDAGKIYGNALQLVRIAVPEFTVEGAGDARATALAATFNKVLWDDLDYSGPLILASRSFYPGTPIRNAADIKSAEWTRPGLEARYIAFGTIQMSGSEFRVNARLHKVEDQSPTFGNRYTSREATERTVRSMAHRFADEILEQLGYGLGIAQTEIVYQCDRDGSGKSKEICVMSYDGQEVTQLTAVGLAATPSWSPDNKKIAFLSFRDDGTNIEIVNRADLRRLPFPSLNGMNATPTWAPKSRQIAFASSSRDPKKGTRIVVADEDGKNLRELTRSDRTDVSPVWNPVTGREIIFASDRSPSPEGMTQLYIMDAEGTNVRHLGKEGGATNNPAWSPDGLLVAFAWQGSGQGNRDIWVMNLKTLQTIQLTSNSGENERPSWAPDGRHIVFASNRSGKFQIYSMLRNGDKTRVLTRGGQNQGPAWSGYFR